MDSHELRPSTVGEIYLKHILDEMRGLRADLKAREPQVSPEAPVPELIQEPQKLTEYEIGDMVQTPKGPAFELKKKKK